MTLVLLGVILAGSFAVLSVVDRFRSAAIGPRRRGQISLALLFLFTGFGHFVMTEPMSRMLPPEVPGRTVVIWLSGVVEWALAVGLFVPRYSKAAGIAAMVFLVLVFPGNVYAVLRHVDFGGHAAGPSYLWIRAPFQAMLIAWAYWSAVRRPSAGS